MRDAYKIRQVLYTKKQLLKPRTIGDAFVRTRQCKNGERRSRSRPHESYRLPKTRGTVNHKHHFLQCDQHSIIHPRHRVLNLYYDTIVMEISTHLYESLIKYIIILFEYI